MQEINRNRKHAEKIEIIVLFLSDGSIVNPILNTQGLPLMDYISKMGYRALVFSREKAFPDPELKETLSSIKGRFDRVDFIHSFEKIHRRGNWFYNLHSDLKTIKKILSFEKVNIIHCRSLIPGLFGLYFKFRSFGKIKLLYDNRGLRIHEEIETGHWEIGSLKERLFTCLEKMLLKYADIITVVSFRFKSYLLDNFSGFNLEKKISVIPNRTILKQDSKNLISQRKKGVPICVYSGSAAKWQSLEEFGKIISASTSVYNEINFLILTYHIREFEKILSQQMILENKITLRQVSQDQVFTELLRCSFGILIRQNDLINNVSSPLKFAEYLSAGLPVLVSEGVGDTERVIEKNRVGIIIRNNDYKQALKEMKKLLEDDEVYSRCRNVAEKEYDINISFKQYLNIYKKLMKP